MPTYTLSGTAESAKPRFSPAVLAWPLLCLVAGLLLWTFLHERLRHERDAAQAAGMNKAAALARAYAEQLSYTLHNLDNASLNLRYHWQKNPGDLGFAEQLKGDGYSPAISVQAAVFDDNGDLLGSTVDTVKRVKRINIAAREDFQIAKLGGVTELQIVGPMSDKLLGREVICFSRPLANRDGGFNGLLSTCVSPAYFASFQDRSSMGRNDFVSLARLDGKLLASKRGDNAGITDALYRTPPLFGGNSGVLRIPGSDFIDEVPRVIAWHALEHYPLISTAGISEPEIYASYDKLAHDYRFAALSASVLLFLLAVTGMVYATRLAWRKQLAEDIRNTYLLAMEGGREGFFMVRTLYDRRRAMADFVVEDCNERGAAYTGFSKEELLGTRFSEFGDHTHMERMITTCRHAMSVGFYEDELETRLDGHTRPIWLHRRFVRSGPGLAVTIRDISDAKAHQETLSKMAHGDALTGLPNRFWLMNYLPQAIARAAESGTMAAVLFIDLDDFKSINDTLGHAAGDELLQSASRRLASAIRGEDKLARLGGDEFTIVLERVETPEVIHVAERIVEAMAEPFVLDNSGRRIVHASVGISLYPHDGTNISTLLRHADAAMYRAKNSGKGRYAFYAPQQDDGNQLGAVA
jgi:diguanylate cyclase (GGDEF)-like protein/PAS domain S-box-containing protein